MRLFPPAVARAMAAITVVCVTLVGTLTTPPVSEAAPQNEIDEAISDGLAWLASTQAANGSWGGFYALGNTGLAIAAFADKATLDGIDPLDPTYQYSDEIQAGLDYIFSKAIIQPIGAQTHGNPDGNGNGTGVFFRDFSSSYDQYEGGICLMAICASGNPDAVVDVEGSVVNGWTYAEVAQDALDYLAWAQGDSGNGLGSWHYSPNDNGSGDQSVAGWVTLGLGYASADPPWGFGLTVPQWVLDQLSVWLDYIQCPDGGAGYTSPLSGSNIYRTGHYLYMGYLVGDTPDTPRMSDAIDYIVNTWSNTDLAYGWKDSWGRPSYEAMVAAMKGFMVNEIDSIGSPAINWYEEFSDAIVVNQEADGHWVATRHGDEYTTSAWALLTLLKAAGVAPSAAFSADPGECFVGDTVTFTSEATGEITSWTWDFGDGSDTVTVTSDDPVTHVYDTRDTDGYDVTLTVANEEGSDSFTTENCVKVYARPEAAFSGTPLSGIGSLQVSFTDASTGDIDSYEWDFDGDGSTDSTDASPTWTYTSPGTYSVSLTVGKLDYTDCETKTDYVTVYEPARAAFTGTPTTGIAPYTVSFADDSTGAIDTWSWDFGDSGSSAAQSPSHEYVTPGVYDISLTVSGDGGTDVETKDNFITVYAPAGAAFAADATEGVAPFTVDFTNLSGGDVDTFVWDFGDGSLPTAPEIRIPGSTHTYTVPGVYTVTLTASGNGGFDTATRVGYITVYEPPVPLFEAKTVTGETPLTVCFRDMSTGDISSWAWDFDGDGKTDSTKQNPCFMYMQPGIYEVTLTVGILDYAATSPEPVDILALKPEKDAGGGPAQMVTSYLHIDPMQVLPGQPVTISANVCNHGGERGSHTASLSVNGAMEQSQSVAVSAGSCKQLTFLVTKAVPGTYQVAVDGMQGQFTVLAPRTVQASVPSQQDTGLGTWGIIAILAVVLVLIVALIAIFRR